MSVNEELLTALLSGEQVSIVPQSRTEAYLKACCNCSGVSGLPVPESRNDVLLYNLSEKIKGICEESDGIVSRTITQCRNNRVTAIGGSAFSNCISLTSAEFANVLTVGMSAFYWCPALTRLKFSKVTSIGEYAFRDTALSTLIIETGSVCSIASADAIGNTPIASGTGFIYVPDDLVDNYKAATGWSTYAAQIKGISEIPEGDE